MFVTETKYNITFMKKTWIIIIAVIAVIAVYGVSSYNSMVSQEEAVGTAWSNVENQYQRRADLIPNLVNTVKGYAAHEKETFDAVVSARAKATQTTVSIDDLTPEKMEAYQRAQGEVGSALSRLLAVTENYPELKANENFQTLQAQLEGTENRISVERRNFNDVARAYNTSIRRFPKNIFAGMFGFEKRPYFEAQEGTEKAPEVKF
jgi:LemA protein